MPGPMKLRSGTKLGPAPPPTGVVSQTRGIKVTPKQVKAPGVPLQAPVVMAHMVPPQPMQVATKVVPVVTVDDSDDDDDVIPCPKKQRTVKQSIPFPVTAATLNPSPPLSMMRCVTPPPPLYVSDEAAQLLREISMSVYTRTFLKSGKFTAEVVPRTSEDYDRILVFIVNSQAHKKFGVKLLSIMKVSRGLDATTPQPSVSTGEDLTMMLFHGTKSSVVASILEHGFRTPEGGGQMFGQGIYFADRVSKSAQYLLKSGPSGRTEVLPGTIGYIFLCEVRLGKVYNARVPFPYNAPPSIVRMNGETLPCDSVKCTGLFIPNRDSQIKIGDVFWPMGPTVRNDKFPTYTVYFNEFIVYDPNRIKIKYLIKVQITSAPCTTQT